MGLNRKEGLPLPMANPAGTLRGQHMVLASGLWTSDSELHPQTTVQSAQVKQAVAVPIQQPHPLDGRKLPQRGLQFSHDARVLTNPSRGRLTTETHRRHSVHA